MALIDVLPHLNGLLNLVIVGLLLSGWRAIRSGDRVRHPRLMGAAVLTGVVFVGTYGLQTALQGHQRFPGDDWVRTLFLLVLWTHTPLAVVVVPLIVRTVQHAVKGRFDAHRRLVRWTLPIWAYVAGTGFVVYAMNNWVRPS